jgi:hypothetical protein
MQTTARRGAQSASLNEVLTYLQSPDFCLKKITPSSASFLIKNTTPKTKNRQYKNPSLKGWIFAVNFVSAFS